MLIAGFSIDRQDALRMEWSKLLKLERLNDAGYIPHKHRPAYAQDIDRILFSLASALVV